MPKAASADGMPAQSVNWQDACYGNRRPRASTHRRNNREHFQTEEQWQDAQQQDATADAGAKGQTYEKGRRSGTGRRSPRARSRRRYRPHADVPRRPQRKLGLSRPGTRRGLPLHRDTNDPELQS